MENKIKEYDILRTVATVLVVIGHCGFFVIQSDYGGCDYSVYAEHLSIIYKIFRKLIALIYSFHMPLYMSLSGALFYISYHKHNGIQFQKLVSSKAKRLLIPFLCVSLCYAVPLKMITGYFHSETLLKDIAIGQLLIQGNTHLWYIATLFFIFMAAYFIIKYCKNLKLLFPVFLLLYFISTYVPIVLLKNIMEYFIWFMIGYIFEPVRKKYNPHVNIYSSLFSLFGFGTVYGLFKFIIKVENTILKSVTAFFIALLGIIAVYHFCVLLAKTKISESKTFLIISDNSYGIYLYSDSVNYVVLFLGILLFQEKIFASLFVSSAFIIIRIVLNFAISIIVTALLKKMKLKYLY